MLAFKIGRMLTLKEEQEMWIRESCDYVPLAEKSVSKKNSVENNQHYDDCTLMQQLSNYCDAYFKQCGECGNQCSHPSGKCSGSCADCLKEIGYHRSDGREEYDCKNMLHYYTCHTIRKDDHAIVDFERRDIYEMFAESSIVTRPQNNYNVIVLQYMIAGDIYSDRAEKSVFCLMK